MLQKILPFMLLGSFMPCLGQTHPQSLDAFLEQAEGYVILDFAASWCKPCYRALPHLQAFAESHPKFSVLVISEDKDARSRDKMIRDLKLNLPVLWDSDHAIAERFNPKGFPATYILNKKGEVVYDHIGFNAKLWEDFVEKAEALP
jgi:thiol-disulfide isomerase/thioredoxin